MSLDTLFVVRKFFASTLRAIKEEDMDEKNFHSENGLEFNPAVNPADFGDHIFKNIQKKK